MLLQLLRRLQRLPENNGEVALISTRTYWRTSKDSRKRWCWKACWIVLESKPKLGWIPLMATNSRGSWAYATFRPWIYGNASMKSLLWRLSKKNLIVLYNNNFEMTSLLMPSPRCPPPGLCLLYIKPLLVFTQHDNGWETAQQTVWQ